MNRSVLPFTLVIVAAFGPASSQAEDQCGIPPDAEIESALAQLQDRDTRLAGLEKLVPFAGYGMNSARPPERDAIVRKAAAALIRYRDVETIGMALGSSNVTVRRWALQYFAWYPADDYPKVDPQRWRVLLPNVRQLAQGPDSTSRGLAQGILFHYAGQREFLDQLVATETTAAHVMRLLHHLDRVMYRSRMNPHLLRILGHQEEDIRRNAMIFIGFDEHRAAMWQIRLNDQVLARVLELSRSPSPEERSYAVYALRYWQNRDLRSVRVRLFELARDPSDEVRRHVPFALRGQLMRDDVQAGLARLVEDESPRVRYFTILVLGPQKYVRELRELAEGPDELIAGFATGQLRKLASQKD